MLATLASTSPRRLPRSLAVGLLLALAVLFANHWFAPLLLVDPLDRYIYETRRVLPTNDLRRQYVDLVPAVIAEGMPATDIVARLQRLGYEEHTKGELPIRLFVKPAGGQWLCGYTYELWLYLDTADAVEDAQARVEGACF